MMEKIRQFFADQDLFARHSGVNLIEMGTGWAKASMVVKPYHFNGAKTVHGGAIFTLADFAFAAASNSHGTLAMGINVTISFVKAVTGGTLFAEARELARNAKLASYSVQITDERQAVVAVIQGMVYRKKESILPEGCPV